MIEEEKKTCTNCGAIYNIKHDLPEEDFKESFCPFCGHEEEINEDEVEWVETKYEDWN
jgi:rRNA maturation endonuclease Nob1